MSRAAVKKTCHRCKKLHLIEMAEEDFDRWELGEHIQNAAPYLSENDRELLISGFCGKCFDEIFAEDDDEE